MMFDPDTAAIAAAPIGGVWQYAACLVRIFMQRVCLSYRTHSCPQPSVDPTMIVAGGSRMMVLRSQG